MNKTIVIRIKLTTLRKLRHIYPKLRHELMAEWLNRVLFNSIKNFK